MPRILFFGSNLTRISRLHGLPFLAPSGGNFRPSRIFWLVLVSALLLLPCSQLTAQQPGYPNYQQYGYGSQNPPPAYAQPQYGQQPQYGGQPQYPPAQPYAQPQYGAQQPYAQQPSPDEAYGAQGQPYAGQPETIQPDANQSYSQPPLSPDQIEQLVAPIALYPDGLLAQILTASTYPAQVAVAHQWLQQMQAQGYGSPDQVAAGADSQNWDPSVKALTAFPQVLEMLNRNLQWTTQLGNAYFNQPQDVMQTVQVLRQRAQNAGNLQSTPQEAVTEDQGAIELAPPSPQVVYVPSYDPWAVYGAPINPYPGFSFVGALGNFFLGGGPLRFGLGIAMTAFENTPWGWLGWGLDWLAHAVLFDHQGYFTNSRSVADWGFPHGGPRAYGGWDRGGHWGGYHETSTGGELGRYTGYDRQPYQGGGSYARGNAFASGGAYGRSGEFNRGYTQPGYGYGRAPQQAFNRPTPTFSRPQTYSGGYGGAYGRNGFGYAARPGQSYAGASRDAAPGRSYASPYSGYRTPQSTYQRSFAEAPSRAFAQPGRSGGFFSHGRDSYGGGRAPKGYSGGRSSGGFKAPRGGGGHSGGHSGGGGHKHH